MRKAFKSAKVKDSKEIVNHDRRPENPAGNRVLDAVLREAPYSRLLIFVTPQVFSGRQNKNALDPLAEVGSKVPKVSSQEMGGTSFDGSQ